MTEIKAKYQSETPQEYLSPPQMADRLRVSSNTVRRYIKRFKPHFKGKRKFGLHWKYPTDPTMGTLKKIHAWYRRGMSRPEIENLLADGTADPVPTPDPMEALGNKIDRLTDAITTLNTLIQSHPAVMPGQGQQITAATNKLLGDIIPTPDGADTVTPSPDEKIGRKAKREKNNSVTEMGEPAADKGRGHDDNVVSFSVADDKTPTPGTPSMETDPDGYRRHVVGIIIDRRDQGDTWVQVKAHLETEGLPTFRGNPVWHVGTISNLYKRNKS